jgi:probable selenium-dependent hydroxylase accessory protein YqeC
MNSNLKSAPTMVKGFARGEKEAKGCSWTLVESLGLGAREMISLVGAGGKTTLMFRLAKELVSKGKRVVTTTTTKILEPSPEESTCLFIDSEDEKIREFVGVHLSPCRHITIARERIEAKKLKGVSSECVGALWEKEPIEYMVVEADGAAGRPVKAPREGEPVIPSDTTVVVALLGVDGMGVELREENVFRSERVSRLTGIPMEGRVTEEAMAILATHPDGIFKGAPVSSRVVVFLNKVDLPNGRQRAGRIAQKILDRRHRQIERVLLGQLRRDPPVVEVLFRQPECQC